jgi:hypothetical protein
MEAWTMKQFRIIAAVALLLLAMGLTSTSMAKMYNSERLDHWLNEHQGIKNKLAANPNLIYNKDFREDHPELRQFLQNHPDVWQKIGPAPRGLAGGPGRWGDYDEHHEWRDADWWHAHDRAWMYRHHPEWVENHPDWRHDDGDWDDSHVWHDRNWWNENHRDWVQRRHADWLRDKDEWKERAHIEKEAYKEHERAEHRADKAEDHAEHQAYKAQEHADKHGHGHGHDND